MSVCGCRCVGVSVCGCRCVGVSVSGVGVGAVVWVCASASSNGMASSKGMACQMMQGCGGVSVWVLLWGCLVAYSAQGMGVRGQGVYSGMPSPGIMPKNFHYISTIQGLLCACNTLI